RSSPREEEAVSRIRQDLIVGAERRPRTAVAEGPRRSLEPRLASRHQENQEERAQGAGPALGALWSAHDAVPRVPGHPNARVLHHLRALRQEVDLGIRALIERRSCIQVGAIVENCDSIVESSGAEETRGGDAGNDSNADSSLQGRQG